MKDVSPETYPMNSGHGTYSYTHNSSYQKGGVQKANEMISMVIEEKLDIQKSASASRFTIADFGCSTGPNTFMVVNNVIEAVELKYRLQFPISNVPEFQVYFNDHVSNDFNTLFESLPPNRDYFAAGVPGSFYTRLLPKASIHFANTSYSLNWMSKVPKSVLDRKSPAWNKGRISYGNAPKGVMQAYSAQFAEDMESYLHSRAEELVPGGLMAIVVMGMTDDVSPSQCRLLNLFDIMGSTLMDMTKTGLVSEDEVDSFNLPVYNPTQQELQSLIEKNGSFSIEKIEALARVAPSPKATILHFRAACEGVFKDHFNVKIIDEMFQWFSEKIAKSSMCYDSSSQQVTELFVLVKRKVTNE